MEALILASGGAMQNSPAAHSCCERSSFVDMGGNDAENDDAVW